jgi:hypothetical protein
VSAREVKYCVCVLTDIFALLLVRSELHMWASLSYRSFQITDSVFITLNTLNIVTLMSKLLCRRYYIFVLFTQLGTNESSGSSQVEHLERKTR